MCYCASIIHSILMHYDPYVMHITHLHVNFYDVTIVAHAREIAQRVRAGSEYVRGGETYNVVSAFLPSRSVFG